MKGISITETNFHFQCHLQFEVGLKFEVVLIFEVVIIFEVVLIFRQHAASIYGFVRFVSDVSYVCLSKKIQDLDLTRLSQA